MLHKHKGLLKNKNNPSFYEKSKMECLSFENKKKIYIY